MHDTADDLIVESLGADLWVARMPLPMRVEPVNCYLGRAPDGSLVVIDTGLDVGAHQLWLAALAQIGAAPADISQIIITHFHPDHIGASATLAELSGADVYASAITVEQTPGVWGPGLADYLERMALHLLRHGMPAARIGMIGDDPTLARSAVRVPDRLLAVEGVSVQFADATWRIIATPGHADGHISLFDAEGRRLIAGDHLLERISPAVGRFPDHATNPLALYLASLRTVAALDIELVLPGHGKSFSHARARCEQLLEHHESRLDACILAIANGAGTTWEVAQQVFGSHHDPMNERFAVTEALAHLALGQARGLVSANQPEASLCKWDLLASDRLVP